MRTLIVTNIVSLDGFNAGPGGNPLVLPMDAAFDRYNLERLEAASAVLLGRRSFEMFHGFWPQVQDDPAASETNREFSRRYGPVPKVVVSDTLASPVDGPWSATTEVVRRADAHARVSALKTEGDGEILTFASGTTWNGLLAAGLVDELHLLVGAKTLGTGVAAFGVPTELRLLDARNLDHTDTVLLKYAPTSAGAASRR